MQVALDRSDRKLLIVAAVALLLLVGATAVLAPPQPAPAPAASSFSPGPDGAKAAYVLLGDLGYAMERWEQPLTELPRIGGRRRAHSLSIRRKDWKVTRIATT